MSTADKLVHLLSIFVIVALLHNDALIKRIVHLGSPYHVLLLRLVALPILATWILITGHVDASKELTVFLGKRLCTV